ncbi:MAG: cysteine desulfurase [Bacteroides sp.]|nr:cysteine desulfurase [Bacteroides sp.]MCM1456769.1 cysteine desulfurase [Lachnoclostridium sp.]
MTIEEIRSQFPILSSKIYGKDLIYLDNAASSQTPRCVVNEIERVYFESKANVHRGVHFLSQRATEAQERTRRAVADFIGADSTDEIIFTRGTTEGINLVASSMGKLLADGDEIIVSQMEHHSNIVPWQLIGQTKRVEVKAIPVTDEGLLNMDAFRSMLSEKTKVVSVCQVSNVLGTVNPVAEIAAEAHRVGAAVVVDGAQGAPHMAVDVKAMDCDFYVFSSHKMYGPTGIGVLYGKREWLHRLPPYQGGGEMIDHVSFQGTTFADIPFKFEAGTPDYVGIAAFGKALEFIDKIGIDTIAAHEHDLLEYTTARMRAEIDGLRIYGTAPGKAGVISFNVDGIHPYDLGMFIDKLGIAVRTGHHCAQPLMARYGIDGCARASFAIYNTREECDRFVDALLRVIPMLR